MKVKKKYYNFGILLILLFFADIAVSIPDFWGLLHINELSNINQISFITRSLSIKMIVLCAICLIYAFIYLRKTKKDLERNNRELRVSNERYRIVTEQSDSIIFEYNFLDKTTVFSGNIKRKFGHEPVLKDCPKTILEGPLIFSEDKKIFENLCEGILQGAAYNKCELRLKSIHQGYIWCKVRVTTIYDDIGKPIRAVGKIIDIDEQKRETQNLKEKAQNDPLTGLYNKITTEILIQNCLKNESAGNHALFIMDIDNFKYVNDNLGHMFGDAVLHDISPKIQNLFRRSDIIGRMGGDEFMILLKDFPSEDIIVDKAKSFCDILSQTFVSEKRNYTISGSIGIAIYPKDGSTYSELYQKADIALYHAKKGGKNSFAFYKDEYEHKWDTMKQDNELRVSNPDTDNDLFDKNLLSFIFEILYQTRDITGVINMVLATAGKKYAVSRAYVYENSENDAYSILTYEWCNDGISSIKNTLNHIYYADYQNFLSQFDCNGVFYCNDVNSLSLPERKLFHNSHVASVLNLAILDNGSFKGFVGFEECDAKRLWTKNEINTLSIIAKVLAIFLVKHRVSDELVKTNRNKTILLDELPYSLYVIDVSNYKLLFFNKKMQSFSETIKVGDVCYSAIYQKNSPCINCPLKQIDDNNQTCSFENFESSFNRQSSYYATKIEWDEVKNAVLICQK